MSGDIGLLMELWGGPLDGEFRVVEMGWPYPDAFTHTSIQSQGKYVRDGDSNRYLWSPTPSTQGPK